jgi:hypothetical protein
MIPYFARVVKEIGSYTINTLHSKIVTHNDSDLSKQERHSELSSTETGQ